MMSQTSFAGFQDFLLDPFNKCEISNQNSNVEKDLSIQYSEYALKSVKKRNGKAILVLPPTGGKNIIDKGYANLFCKKGYKVYILEDWTGVNDAGIDFKMHQRYQTSFQKSVKFLIDQIKEEKIGVLGASAGAINFSVTLGVPEVVDKVQAFVGIVSGGPLCKVIASTMEQGLEGLRKRRKEKFGIETQEEYEKNICNNLNWDLAKTKPNHLKLALITSNNDETVLTKYQKGQVKNLIPDLHIELDSSHRGTVIRSFLLYRHKISKFFSEGL